MFEHLTEEEIISAIQFCIKNEDFKESAYAIWYNGKYVSAPGVVKKACELKGIQIERSTFNTDQAQKVLLEKGFPIVQFNVQENFFSEKELQSFSNLVARPVYDKSNLTDKNIGKFLNQVIWEKTFKWAKQLRKLGWEIKGAKHWNEQDPKGQRYKKYTRYKIYPKSKRSDLLYYTVGVNTDGSLVYKLDIQRVDSFFTKEKRDFFDDHTVPWKVIRPEEVKSHNWNSLVDLTKNFLHDKLELYNFFSKHYWPNKRLMRLTWNTNNWETPIKHKWKPENQKNKNIAHERKHGYGYEEWLFNQRYSLNGFQYGYIRGVDGMSEEPEEIEELTLFTINEQTKDRYIVGTIKNVQIIEGVSSELDQVKELYARFQSNVFQELKEVEADYKNILKDNLIPNVKFKWENVALNNNLIPSEFLEGPKFNRFQPYYLDDEIEGKIIQSLKEDNRLKFVSGKNDLKREYTKQTNSNSTKVIRTHTDIANDLYDYCLNIENYNAEQLSLEKTRVAGALVDFAILEENQYSIFEIKTNNVGLKNIRQALGQLFEYAFMDQSIKIKKLVIVGPAFLSPSEKKYFTKLISIFDVRIEYWAYNKADERLSDRFVKQEIEHEKL